jgi:two-component system, OmpR family, sensor histidine kinase CiaH
VLFSSRHLLLITPWLLFVGLGGSMVRLAYQALQEQSLLEALAAKLKRERALLEQKQNFVRLSSHYLRTPLTLINTGIESMAAQKADKATINRLNQAGQRLSLGVNGLLEQGVPKTAATAAAPAKLPNASLYLYGSLAGAFIIICIAVYLLGHLNLANFKTGSLAGVAVLLVVVTAYSARRSRTDRQQLKKHFEELLAQQRALEKQRNDLVRGALENLSNPLAELKTALKPLAGQPMAKATLEGTKNFEAVLGKFIILTSLEAGAMTTLRQPVSLSQMTAKIAEHYRPMLEQKNLQIRTELKADELNQDPLLLQFVLDSLVNNAIQYSPEGKFIDIISRRSGANTDIFVRDQAGGIATEKLAILFQPFSRAENVEEHFEHQGLGLSLYLDKLIMRYLGGAIQAESKAGQGTSIKLRLPA